jgi:catechol 2,3-dioxygenase-like lactoylglutathione lyase family enzyme
VLDHACLRVPDLAAAGRFYDAVFAVLGYPRVGEDEGWIGYGLRADLAHPERCYVSLRTGAVSTQGAFWAFRASEPGVVDAFRAAGLASGGRMAARLPVPVAGDGVSAVLVDPAGHRIAAVYRP